jgi:hypothetical protein
METPHARRRARAEPRVHFRDLGEGALDFAKWFRKSRFDLMAGFYGELAREPGERDVADVERRFLAAIRHGKRVLLARGVVSVLLVLGVVATAGAAAARVLWVPDALTFEVQATLAALDRLAAIAGSITVVLVALRLLFDRYLELVDTSATFLAMQLASCARR